ncbi:PIF1-like helicase-domain-containing protein [Pilaira anomala]|nr:PIF1-like helicase-domain-containing protein [Pilaira anomala]
MTTLIYTLPSLPITADHYKLLLTVVLSDRHLSSPATSEFFSNYVIKKWGKKVGGIIDWTSVMEIQDRGSPHMHFVLWTGTSAEELLADEDIVSARLPEPDDPMYQLVLQHQIHRLITTNSRLWRAREVAPSADTETYYYQQIVLNLVIFNTTFIQHKNSTMSEYSTWKEFYIYLTSTNQIPQLNHIPEANQIPPNEPTQYNDLSQQQKYIFNQINHSIETRNIKTHWIIGAAGTGKSYLLKAFKYYYQTKGYSVVTLAPTGVAAYNIEGQTIHRYFGMTNNRNELNKLKLTHHLKLDHITYKNDLPSHAIRLYTTRRLANAENEQILMEIPVEKHTFVSLDELDLRASLVDGQLALNGLGIQ